MYLLWNRISLIDLLLSEFQAFILQTLLSNLPDAYDWGHGIIQVGCL